MWFLPTRGRKQRCQAVLDAIEKLGPSDGLVYVDGDHYKDLKLPRRWRMICDPVHRELGGVLRECFRLYPGESVYGWLSDDTVPQTRGWATALELSAGQWRMASSNDLWKGDSRMAGALCFGGDLLRALGYWVPEGMCHLYVDDVWERLAERLGNWRYRSDVVVEHLHFANGKRIRDNTDSRTHDGKGYASTDEAIYRAWLGAQADRDAERVKEAMNGAVR